MDFTKITTILERLVWILLTISIFIVPLWGMIQKVFAYGIHTSKNFFGIVKNMTPDDFLRSTSHDALNTTEATTAIKNDISNNEFPSNHEKEQKSNQISDSPIHPKQLEKLQALKQEAIQLKEKGNLEEAEKKLVEGSTLYPEEREIQKMLHEVYFEQGKFVKSATLLKKILTHEPNNHRYLWQLGSIHNNDGETEIAHMLFEKAIQLKDDNPKYYISLIDLHTNALRYEEAVPLLEKLHKLRPSNIEYVLSLATIHEELQNKEKSQLWYTKALALDPHHPIAKRKL